MNRAHEARICIDKLTRARNATFTVQLDFHCEASFYPAGRDIVQAYLYLSLVFSTVGMKPR